MSNVDSRIKGFVEFLQEENKKLRKELDVIKSPTCDGVTAHAINEVGWFLNESLTNLGDINSRQFNNLKPIFCAAVELYVKHLTEAAQESVE